MAQPPSPPGSSLSFPACPRPSVSPEPPILPQGMPLLSGASGRLLSTLRPRLRKVAQKGRWGLGGPGTVKPPSGPSRQPVPTSVPLLFCLQSLEGESGGGRPVPGRPPSGCPTCGVLGGQRSGPPPWTFWPRCRPVGLREGAAWAEGMERSAWGDRRPARPEHPSVQMRLRDPKDPGHLPGPQPGNIENVGLA